MPKAGDEDNFKEIYAQAVTEAMSILGEGTSLVTGYIERKYGIDLASTADNPRILSEALDAAIDGGARVIQRRILRLLYDKMNIKVPSTMMMTVDFEGKISQAKKDFAESIRGG